VQLYSDEGSFEITFADDDGRGPVAVTQPELNRIVQSLRRVPKDEPAAKNNQSELNLVTGRVFTIRPNHLLRIQDGQELHRPIGKLF